MQNERKKLLDRIENKSTMCPWCWNKTLVKQNKYLYICNVCGQDAVDLGSPLKEYDQAKS